MFWPIKQKGLSNGVYPYSQGDVFTPGAEAAAFHMFQPLPVVTTWGNGTLYGRFLRPMQPPQVYTLNPRTTAGIGGRVAGYFVLAPLIAPDE